MATTLLNRPLDDDHRAAASVLSRQRRAFTLVELLVVIGIISVLIAILMPALQRARESANGVRCLSNIRQLSITLTAYINDNKGQLPTQTGDIGDFANPAVFDTTGGVNCLASLSSYFNSIKSAAAIWICPSAGENPYGANPVAPSDTNYMVNAVVMGHSLSRINDTSAVVWLQEDSFHWNIAYMRPQSAGGAPRQYDDWCFSTGTVLSQTYSNIHNIVGSGGSRTGGGNVGYLDGHADYRTNGSLHPTDLGLVGIPGTSSSNDPNTVSQSQPYYGAFDN